MRRIPTMMASAGAAALTALAVTVAAPAIGDDGGATKPARPADRATEEQQLRSCLADHGAAVPTVEGGDLKRWIVEHQGDPATAAALKACGLVIDDHPKPGGCEKEDPEGKSAAKPGDKPGVEAEAAKRAKAARHAQAARS